MAHKQASREKAQTLDSGETKGNEDLDRYLPLYGAALEGDWESAKEFVAKHSDAVNVKITNRSETALHIAVTGGKAMEFVKELVPKMKAESIEAVDCMEGTALFYAAAVGNTEVARLLGGENKNLTQIPSTYGRGTYTPLHMAAKNGHKDTVEYLLPLTTDDKPSLLKGKSGVYLLKNLISANFIGMALDLLKRSHLGLAEEEDLHSFILPTLAQKPSMFESGSKMGYWKRKVYSWIKIPKEEDNSKNSSKDSSATSKNMVGEDIENPIDSPKDCCATFKNTFGTMRGKVFVMLKNTINQMVSCIIHIYQTKMMHAQTLETVKLMLEKMTLSEEKASEFLKEPLFRAIELGIHELVKEIIKAYPPSVFFP